MGIVINAKERKDLIASKIKPRKVTGVMKKEEGIVKVNKTGIKGGKNVEKEVSLIRSENTMEVEITKPNTSEKKEEQGKQHEEKKVKLILYQNEWLYEEEFKEKNIRGKEENNKFNPNHKGDIIIKMNVKNENKLKTRILNNMKIANFLYSKNLKIDCMKITGFNKSEVKFMNIIEANCCLDLVSKQNTKIIEARIPVRVSRRKGVITDWDQEMDLKEALD